MGRLVYRFEFPDGRTESLDAAAPPPQQSLPAWTALGFHQCANCPLTPAQAERCPMAVAIQEDRRVRGITAVAERPDGTRVHFMPFPTPLHDASDRLVGAVNVLIDLGAAQP